MINHNVDNIFNRSGLAAFSDLSTLGYQSIFAHLEKEQETFLDKETEFRSSEYKWPRAALHNFSRVWEYPYVYYHLFNSLHRLPEKSQPLVADVGSGVTFFPFSIAKLGYQVVCADIDHVCARDLALASKCVPHAPGSVDFKLIEGDRIPFADSECDAVYCISVLEHIPEFEKTIAEIVRILKPEGLCLITCDINLAPEDKRQLDTTQYMRLLSAIDTSFSFVYPERTIHPLDILTTFNSPYAPYPSCRQPGLMERGYQLIKQKINKYLLGLENGKVLNTFPHLAVLGLVLKKSKY